MQKGKDHTCEGSVKLSSSSIGVQPEIFRHNTGHLRFYLRFHPSIGHHDTRLMSSSRAVSEPDMPMADRAYTCTPRNGVATSQYFMESEREREKGIPYNALVKSVAMMCFHRAIRYNVESTSGTSKGWGLL